MADSRNAGIQSRGNYKTSFLHCQSLGQLWSPTTSSLGAMLNRDSKEGSSGGPPRHLWGSLKRWRLAERELWVAQGKTAGKRASFIYPGMAQEHPCCVQKRTLYSMGGRPGTEWEEQGQAWPHRACLHLSVMPENICSS